MELYYLMSWDLFIYLGGCYIEILYMLGFFCFDKDEVKKEYGRIIKL